MYPDELVADPAPPEGLLLFLPDQPLSKFAADLATASYNVEVTRKQLEDRQKQIQILEVNLAEYEHVASMARLSLLKFMGIHEAVVACAGVP